MAALDVFAFQFLRPFTSYFWSTPGVRWVESEFVELLVVRQWFFCKVMGVGLSGLSRHDSLSSVDGGILRTAPLNAG